MNNHSFLQPKNALQRAEELRTVGQEAAAFEVLHKTINDRRFRYLQWDATAQQEVVTQYVTLAVKLDNIKQAREGLLQYRNHCQHGVAHLGPLEKVLLHLRDCAEAKLASVESLLAADDANPLNRSDADPAEMLILASISPDTSSDLMKEQRDTQRLVLDVYKTIIDIIKTTPKLHMFYHKTVHRAYDFCRKYNLRSDFRRLAETVRNHYLTIMKLKAKQDADSQTRQELEELKCPELHIETRLSQLTNAAALEVWKEAMQTIEDLYSLGVIELASKRVSPKKSALAFRLHQLLLSSLAAYYEKLSEVFAQSGFHNLHALALLRWLNHTKQNNKAMSARDYSVLASIAVLAVLAVPLSRVEDARSGPRYEEEKRLTILLGQPNVPTRAGLVALVRDRDIVGSTLPCVQKFFHLMEQQDPLPFGLVDTVMPLFDQMRAALAEADAQKGDLETIWEGGSFAARGEQYIEDLHNVVFRKLIIKLACLYDNVTIDFLRKHICPDAFMPWTRAEHALVSLEAQCKLNLRLDHANGVIRLSTVDRNKLASARLGALSSSLLKALSMTTASDLSMQQESEMLALRKRIPTESKVGASRLDLLEKRRVELESFKKRRDENLEELAKEKAQKQHDMELQKARQLAEERAQMKRREEAEAARQECARQLLDRMTIVVKQAGATPATFNICGTPLQSFTADTLLSRRVTFKDFETSLDEFVSRTKQDAIRLKKLEQKKVDHWARAIRMEEAAHIDKWAEKVAEEDRECVARLKEEKAEARAVVLSQLKKRREAFIAVVDQLERWAESNIADVN